jgi:Cyclic GMP-AMP synthase DncV-like, nucleotidyltransferase domain
MNIQSRTTTAEVEDYLEALADELEIPEHRYEQAEARYQSVGRWLNRENSTIRQYGPDVYSQGSFQLGTVIAPISDQEQYDIDAVCEFKKLSKRDVTQKELKRRLGVEVELYRRAQNMTKQAEEHRRCWRLEYTDEAQFHMDVTPGVPNAAAARAILEGLAHDPTWAATAIAITDKEAPSYALISDDWLRSNPRGYRKWFHSRMAAVFEERKKALQKGVRAGTEPIPDYRVRTPLQSSIMILKRDRDIMFVKRPDERPISIILTTLAAHAYNGERKIADALFAILSRMDQYILRRPDGTYVIPNPTDSSENFADKWAKHPERAAAFFEWLARARQDFSRAAVLSNRQIIAENLEKAVGIGLADRAKKRSTAKLAAPAVLSQGLIRSEAQARRSAVNLQGDRRNA